MAATVTPVRGLDYGCVSCHPSLWIMQNRAYEALIQHLDLLQLNRLPCNGHSLQGLTALLLLCFFFTACIRTM